jgi:hypothetical protein
MPTFMPVDGGDLIVFEWDQNLRRWVSADGRKQYTAELLSSRFVTVKEPVVKKEREPEEDSGTVNLSGVAAIVVMEPPVEEIEAEAPVVKKPAAKKAAAKKVPAKKKG